MAWNKLNLFMKLFEVLCKRYVLVRENYSLHANLQTLKCFYKQYDEQIRSYKCKLFR